MERENGIISSSSETQISATLNTDEEIKNKILDKCIVSSLHPNVYMLEVKARLPLIGKDHHKIICHGMVIFMYRIYLTKFVIWTLEGPSRLHEQSSLVNIPLVLLCPLG